MLVVGVASQVVGKVKAQQPSENRDAIHEVLAAYYDAFARDPAAAATYYGEPALILAPNDLVSLPTRKDAETFLAKLLGSLKTLGYSNTKLTAPRIKMLNPTTALYGTVAIRMKTDGTELERAGFTYLLHKVRAGWKINGIVATDLDKLISSD
jgi:hypothetical protein